MRLGALVLLAFPLAAAGGNIPLGERAKRYLTDLIRLDTSNPPGRETRAARYLKQVADSHGIPCELLGPDPRRLNFVARLRGSGEERPLLLMAHSDVVPADRSQWSAEPFGGEVRDGYVYGRGAIDAKSLLAAELAVLVEIKRRNVKLKRDLILLAEADEEAGSSGIQWMIANAWPRIDAEFALNEGGSIFETSQRHRVFQIQTAEKVPTRVVLSARGNAGHGSLPRPDNPIVRLSRAITRLVEADQPARLNATTRHYLRELARLPDSAWLAPLLPKLENPATATMAANQVRARDPELDVMLRTSLSPTLLRAGMKNNMIPNSAEAQIDVRRLPDETREEVVSRIRHMINDTAIEVSSAPGPHLPATESSPLSTALYRAVERIVASQAGAALVPYMSRGATDGAFLRARGVAVYGVPVFNKDRSDSHAHGNDERISLTNLEDGTQLLWRIVIEVAAQP